MNSEERKRFKNKTYDLSVRLNNGVASSSTQQRRLSETSSNSGSANGGSHSILSSSLLPASLKAKMKNLIMTMEKEPVQRQRPQSLTQKSL